MRSAFELKQFYFSTFGSMVFHLATLLQNESYDKRRKSSQVLDSTGANPIKRILSPKRQNFTSVHKSTGKALGTKVL